MALVAYIVAIVIFVLVALGVDFDKLSALELTALGLVAFVLGHVLGAGLPTLPRRGE